MKHRELMELLSYRDDDESLTAQRRAELAADPELADKLAHLATIVHALRNLPEEPPGAEVWGAVEARLIKRRQTRRAPRYGYWWPALAASVCLVVLGAWVWTVHVDHAEALRVAELINTSQLLERSWLARHHDADSSAVYRALLYRIASVDSQLNDITADGRAKPADVQALWRNRVALLQSLLEVDQSERLQYTTL